MKIVASKKVFLKTLFFLCRLILSLVFIYAAITKSISPQDLALTIVGYKIGPVWLAAPVAIILPFLELCSAVSVLSFRPNLQKAGLFILASLLIFFMLLVAFNLLRGIDFDCGCFGSNTTRKPGLWFFLQDGLLLLLALVPLTLEQPFKKTT